MCLANEARILPRSEHNLSRRDIDADALKVLYRLHRNGHMACLVGGSVRDLLLDRVPKDYDIGTDARPEQILDLFRNSRIIGRRFPIVHILFGSGKVIEVATFRSGSEEEEAATLPSDQDSLEEEARLEAEVDTILAENGNGEDDTRGQARKEPAGGEAELEGGRQAKASSKEKRRHSRRLQRGRHLLEFMDEAHYGSPAEDARRRDLTINGLLYDIGDFSVIDYVGGLDDLSAGLIRAIGDPDVRFANDPVRIIRALRHSARIGFRIEPETWAAILKHKEKIADCSKARVLEEFYRDLRGGAATESLKMMKRSGVLSVLLPEFDRYLPDWETPAGEPAPPVWRRLEILDRCVGEGEAFSSAFLLSFLFANPLLEALAAEEERIHPSRPDIGRFSYRFLKPLTSKLGVARRDTERLFLISISQRRLARCREGQPIPAFFRNKPYFEEAFRLFELDCEARGIELGELKFAGRRRQRRSRRRRRR